jgi:hypothetical protein
MKYLRAWFFLLLGLIIEELEPKSLIFSDSHRHPLVRLSRRKILDEATDVRNAAKQIRSKKVLVCAGSFRWERWIMPVFPAQMAIQLLSFKGRMASSLMQFYLW